MERKLTWGEHVTRMEVRRDNRTCLVRKAHGQSLLERRRLRREDDIKTDF